MTTAEQALSDLRAQLAEASDPTFAVALQRYFPDPVAALAVRNADVVNPANAYLTGHPRRTRGSSRDRRAAD